MSNRVSIIIPVFNRKQTLKRAIESVLRQTFKNFELIIIDDCSTDDLTDTVNKFNDNRIVFKRNQQNHGVSFSRNAGIKLAQYDFIAFLDSDDEWLPHKLENQLTYFAAHPHIRVVHTEEIWIRDGVRVNQMKKHQKSGGDIFKRSLNLCLMSPSSIMMKRKIFDDYGMFDENLQVCEDYDLWLKISAAEEVGFIKEPQIIKYGGHSDQLSRKYSAMDKFRVNSLLNILRNSSLTETKREDLKKVLIKKTTILLNGARKRTLNNEVHTYEQLLKNIDLQN